MDLENIIIDTFSQPHHAMAYYISRRLRCLFPDKGIVESAAHYFDLHGYAAEGLCTLSPRQIPHPHVITSSAAVTGAQTDVPRNALIDVTWEGETLSVLLFSLPSIGDSQQHYYAIIAETADLAHAFHAAVCAWSTRLNDEVILVFDVNGWNRDEALYAAIKNATLDNLVLEGTLKADILSDITGFFSAREMYAEYDVPWKRGILFVGPAGNGKTHAVKALINRLDQTCLYVKTFGGGGPGDQWGIRAIFAEARSLAPCILVLEDLDSLITQENRSYFLNELDGFAGNSGLLTLATTNHPDRLDPAIVDRPSRFDRKYPFKPPAYTERETYIGNWNDHLKEPLRLSRQGVQNIAAQTEDFSFAYLKELFLSAMMRWIADPTPGAMDGIMASQAPVLRDQMASVIELPSDPGYGGEDGMPHAMSGPARRGGPRRHGPVRGPHVPG